MSTQDVTKLDVGSADDAVERNAARTFTTTAVYVSDEVNRHPVEVVLQEECRAPSFFSPYMLIMLSGCCHRFTLPLRKYHTVEMCQKCARPPILSALQRITREPLRSLLPSLLPRFVLLLVGGEVRARQRRQENDSKV